MISNAPSAIPGDELTLDRTLSYFAWHSRHHVAQILDLRVRKGW